MMALLQAKELDVSIGKRKLITGLNIEIKAGESWALLGRNGAGKTTLLHTLARLRPSANGSIRLQGTAIEQFSRKDLALHIGLLFQEGLSMLPTTVMETAMLGRYPHQQSWLWDTREDMEAASAALRDFSLEELAQRSIETLSGGELQRLALARLVAQAPIVYLLDEPSNHLDITHQLAGLLALQVRMRQQQAAMMMATHDINLASRICDHVLLLGENGNFQVGSTEEVLTEANLSRAYDCEIRRIETDAGLFFTPVVPVSLADTAA